MSRASADPASIQFANAPEAEGGERTRALRAALRSLFTAACRGDRPPLGALALVNRASAAAPAAPRLEWPEAGVTRVVVRRAGSARAAELAAIADDAIETLREPGRVCLCEAPGCEAFFILSHPRRSWCSAACGNRARVARHARRRRAALS